MNAKTIQAIVMVALVVAAVFYVNNVTGRKLEAIAA